MANPLSGSVQTIPQAPQPTAVGQLCVALASQNLGNEVASAINAGQALAFALGAPGATTPTVYTYTPPTSSTDVLTVSGYDITVTFATSATQTVTNLKKQVAANAAIAALWTVTGTTTAIFTSKLPGAQGNQSIISDAGSNSASLAFTTYGKGPAFISAWVADATTSTSQLNAATLLPGDFVVDMTTYTASGLCVSAGTLPQAPTAHDVLLVLRPYAAVPAATAFSF